MANFGWAYINCSDSGSSDGGSRGPTGAIQFYSGAGISTGSSRFIFSGSESGSYTLFLTGTLKISGAISASSFVVDTIHHIDATGSTFFGDTSDDVHIRTGSLHMSHGAYIIGVLSASNTFHAVNHGTFGATIESSGSILTKGGLFSHAEVSASGQLEAVGATRLGSTLAVSGAMTSVASITSSATIEAGSHISGGATLQAVGATILGSSLAVSGASSLQALSASAYSGSYTFHTQEAATFGSTLTSTGSATFKSIVIGSSVNNTIGHVDDVDLVTLTNRTITLSADSILSGSQLSASRDVSVVGSITGSANLAISGNSIFAGNITVGGAIIGGSPVHVSGGLVISGSDGSVTYIGSGSTGGTAFPASATVTGSLLVSGSTTITGSLMVTGSSTIYNYGSFVNYILDPTVPRETRSFFVQGSDGFVSGSNNLEIVGTMKSIGSITTSGSIDGGGDLTMNTITMTGFGVTNDGTTSVKSLKVDDNSTVGSDSDPDLLTIAGDGNLQIKGNISASGTSHTVGISTFSSTISATGSISGSYALSVVNSITSSANIAASGSLVIGEGEWLGIPDRENVIQLNDGNIIVDGVIFAQNSISGSQQLQVVGASILGNTLTVSGNVTTAGDIILDDGGSIKEGGGVAAITIDGSGNITKLGQSTHSTNDVLTWDGAKWVATADASHTSLSGTTAELTTGVETSGYLKVSGSSTLGVITGTTYSGSSTLHAVGAATFGSTVASSGSVTSAGLVSSGLISGSDALMIMSVAQFGSNAEVTGALSVGGTLVGAHANGTISSSAGITTVGSITSSANIAASGSLVLGMGSFVGAHGGKENLIQLNDGHVLVNGALFVTDGISGSNIMHNVGAATFSSTLAVSGNITTVGDLILDDGGSIKEGGGTAAITIDGSGNVTKIGQDTPSNNEVLTYDGAKWVASAVGGGTATSVSGTTAELTTGVETSGYLKVSGSSTLTDVTATTYSGSSTMHVVGAATLGSTLSLSGAISGSSTLEAVGATILGNTLTVSGNVTTAGDLILDDGGSIKEGGGTAAITIDGSGNVTKIGQDTPSTNEVLTYDGAKWVASAAAGGAATSVSGTTAELTTGVETSGYLKVSGSSTLTDVTATTYSGSSTMHVVGATTLGSTLALSGNIDSGGDLTAATITMTGFVVDADGDTALKSLAVDDGSTIGCDSDTDLLTLASGALLIKGNVSGSGTSIQAGAASFSSTVAATGSVTAAGLNSTGLISGSSAITVVGNATFTGNLNASGSVSLQGTEPRVMFTGSDGTALGQIGFNASNNILIQNNFNNKHIVFKATDNSVVKEGIRLDGSVPEVVVNQNGASQDNNTLVDFRVESDNNTHMLYVQGSTDKVGINTNAPLQAFSVVGGISGSSTLHAVGAATLGSTLSLTGAISAGGPLTGPHAVGTLSSSAGLTTVGAVVLGSTLIASGNITTAGDLILDDGGSIKEGGGTAAITIDGSGHVTKIGQDSPSSGEVLTYDGAKWVASAAGSVTSLSGTTAELTTRIETSGFLKVSGNIDTAGDLTAATITMTGFVVDADGDTALKSLAVDDGSTIGCDSDTDLLTLVQNALLLKGALSSSGTSIQAGTADFSSTVAASGSITSVGVNNTGIYSGSSTMNVIGEATFGAAVLATGSVVAHTLTASAGGVGLGNLIDAEIAGANQAGTNVAGKNLIIRPSSGTGNGAPAFVEIQAPVPGSSGTAVQTASPVIHIAGEGPKFFYNSVTTLLNDEGTGEILRMGTGTTTAGKLYFLHSGSAWFEADANIEQSGSAMLLAIALGSNPVNNGMLVKGFFNVNSHFTGAFPVGQQVYMSDAAGQVSGYRLSGSGEVVRVIGHATTQTNVIYFNPSVDFLVL